MGVCNCSMFCCTLLYVHSSIAISLMAKRELIALLNLSSWCLLMVERLFLAVPRGSLQFVIVVFPDHTHLLFLTCWENPTTHPPTRKTNGLSLIKKHLESIPPYLLNRVQKLHFRMYFELYIMYFTKIIICHVIYG